VSEALDQPSMLARGHGEAPRPAHTHNTLRLVRKVLVSEIRQKYLHNFALGSANRAASTRWLLRSVEPEPRAWGRA
jgi:hypothetical protein